MDTQPNPLTPLGTAKQAGLIRQLAQELGFADADEALAAVGAKAPLTVPDASAAIDRLKARVSELQGGGVEKPSAKSSEAAAKPRYLTARNLLQIHNGAMPVPENLDGDAAEVLQRLARLSDVERAFGSLPPWPGVNNGGPIEVQQVIEYFGTIEVTAAAFGVGIDTVRSWGTYIPEKRAYEAQVKTRGRVCAPRR